MDNKDKQILEILQIEGRISNVKLAEKIDLTPPATLERVKKLEESGYITGYSAEVDSGKLDYRVPVLIAVTLVKHEKEEIENFMNFMKNCPEIVGYYHVTGIYDYILKVQKRDIKDLQDFLINRLTGLKGIDKAETFLILEEYSSPVPIS